MTISNNKFYCVDCGSPLYSCEDDEACGGPPYRVCYGFEGNEYCYGCLPDKENKVKIDWETDDRLKKKQLI